MNEIAINNFRKKLICAGANALGCGRHREVYRRNNFVYKLPHPVGGEGANKREFAKFKEHGKVTPGGTPLARCRLLKNNVLVMEYLKPPEFNLRLRAEVPKWAHGWDSNEAGAQIGLDKRGNLKMFDYAE